MYIKIKSINIEPQTNTKLERKESIKDRISY